VPIRFGLEPFVDVDEVCCSAPWRWITDGSTSPSSLYQPGAPAPNPGSAADQFAVFSKIGTTSNDAAVGAAGERLIATVRMLLSFLTLAVTARSSSTAAREPTIGISNDGDCSISCWTSMAKVWQRSGITLRSLLLGSRKIERRVRALEMCGRSWRGRHQIGLKTSKFVAKKCKIEADQRFKQPPGQMGAIGRKVARRRFRPGVNCLTQRARQAAQNPHVGLSTRCQGTRGGHIRFGANFPV
jgi:hypothetical protein